MIEIALVKTLQGDGAPFRLEVQAKVDSGCFVTLFGPSGSGKTTLLRMLAGIEWPDSGKIAVDGVTWFDAERGINLPPQERAIGFVFQDYALFPNLTVRQNVAYAAPKGEARLIDELLELTALSSLQQRLPPTLSGGQKQRVALARAIARKPSLLLLDEPLSALDTALRSRMQDDLAHLHRRFGLTTLLVSHDIGEVFKLSRQVLLMEDGRIAQMGTPDEIFLRRRLSSKLNLHAQVLAIRREDVVNIVSLLIGQEIVDVIASDQEAADLHPGDFVELASKAVSALLFKKKM